MFKLKKMLKSDFLLLFLLLGLLVTNPANAVQTNTTIITNPDGSLSITTPTIVPNSSTPPADNPLTYGWHADYEKQNLILIASDDINIPIEIDKSALILSHETRGRFAFTNGELVSLTRNPVFLSTHADGTDQGFTSRPTLFITIKGATGNIGDNDVQKWQHRVTDEVSVRTVLEEEVHAVNSQYRSQMVYWAVGWESHPLREMGSQVKILKDQIESFMKQRTIPWDVVIVGFSRGGIFAHSLINKLSRNNINNLHTILLDPTTGGSPGDYYPQRVNNSNKFFGSLYYDKQQYLINTISDLPISGYDNYGRGISDFLFPEIVTSFPEPHETFAERWVLDQGNQGLRKSLEDIWIHKIPGTFLTDGVTSNFEIVKIKHKSFIWNISASIESGNLTVASEISLGTGASLASFTGTIRGDQGFDVVIGTMLGTAQASLNEDGLYVAQSNAGIQESASISGDGINVQTNTLNALSASATIEGNGDVIISARIFDLEIELSLGGSTGPGGLPSPPDPIGDVVGPIGPIIGFPPIKGPF